MDITINTLTMDKLMSYCREYNKRPHIVCNEVLDLYMSDYIEKKTNVGDKNGKETDISD